MRAFIFTILLFVGSLGFSQINTPRFSPATEIKQMVGLTEIEVKYSRPSMRGREVFGNLVPFGKVWRTQYLHPFRKKKFALLMFESS